MSLNKTNLALVITLALTSTPAEIDATLDEARDFLLGNSGDNAGIAPETAAAIVNGTSNANLDAAGLPWDERIHSSTKDRNKDNTWRARRNVDKALVAKVEAELRTTLAAPAAAANTAPPAAAAPPAAPPAMPTPPGLPPIPGAAAPAATPEQTAYTNLVQYLVLNTNSPTSPNGRLTDQYIKDMLTHYGVADGSLQNLAHRPDLVPIIDAAFKTALA